VEPNSPVLQDHPADRHLDAARSEPECVLVLRPTTHGLFFAMSLRAAALLRRPASEMGTANRAVGVVTSAAAQPIVGAGWHRTHDAQGIAHPGPSRCGRPLADFCAIRVMHRGRSSPVGQPRSGVERRQCPQAAVQPDDGASHH